MSAKKPKDHLIRECPNCGVRNKIPLDFQHRKVRCGECKKELPPMPEPRVKPNDSAAPCEEIKPLVETSARDQTRMPKATSKKKTGKPSQKQSKSVTLKTEETAFPEKPIRRDGRLNAIEISPAAMVQNEGDSTSSISRPESILSISFDEAMQINPLLEQLGKQVQFDLAKHIASHGGGVLANAVAGAAIIAERGTVVVKFSAEGAKLLKAKELRFMGKFPTLVNKAGRTVENAKISGPLTTGSRVAANLTMAVITVAHVISGADLAKKLNKLDSKVDFLVAAHRIDQLARIEGVYRQAKQILNMEQNDHTRWELHRMGRELFEVRSAWRREISFHVGNLQKTDESQNWFLKRFQSLSRKAKDQKVASTVSACDAEIQLISGSIAIHLALVQAAGTLETFLQVSLPDEIAELQHVRSLLRERRSFIHEKHPELREAVSAACDRLDDVARIYRPMIIPSANRLAHR